MNPIDKFTNIDAVYPITDAKEKELEKNTDLLNDAKWLIDDLMYACEMNEIIFDFPEKDLSYSS